MEAIKKHLDQSRRELLDLSTRNRLISVPINSRTARMVQVFDELASETFQRLVVNKGKFTFVAGKENKPGSAGKARDKEEGEEGEYEEGEYEGKERISHPKNNARLPLLFESHSASATTAASLPDPDQEILTDLPLPSEDDIDAVTGKAKRHTDNRLQTRLTPDVLQRRLFDLYNESRTIIEEQGVNILYLALGLIKWVDKSNAGTERYAPLLLIPVELERKSASDKFNIRWREEDLQDNLSLAEKFKIEFNVTLPPLNIDDPESFDINEYYRQVQEAISPMPGWSLDADGICLGFFSFAKFLMYKDLDADSWPEENNIAKNPLITRLLLTRQEGEGKAFENPHATVPDGPAALDKHIPVEKLDHIVDADSSQTRAIELVRQGHNLVIQGPPGTGKSQTITNIIATAVLDGRKVLFLAEKLAALEVVQRRLEKEGLGVLCLELHSNKARKAEVAADLKATWELGKPVTGNPDRLYSDLSSQRSELNAHPQALHAENGDCPSAFQHLGVLASLGQPQGPENDIRFPGAETWTEKQTNEYREHLSALQRHALAVAPLDQNPWRGIRQTRWFGTERQLLLDKLDAWLGIIAQLQSLLREITPLYAQSTAAPDAELCRRLPAILHLAASHPTDRLSSLNDAVWQDAGDLLLTLAQKRSLLDEIQAEMREQVMSAAWKENYEDVRQAVREHGGKWYKFIIGAYRRAKSRLKSALKISLPGSKDAMLSLVDRIITGQEAYQYVFPKERLGKEAFGYLWETDNAGLHMTAIAQWMKSAKDAGLSPAEREAAYAAEPAQAARHLARLQDLLKQSREACAAVTDILHPDAELLSPPSLQSLADKLRIWQAQTDGLPDWVAMQQSIKQVQSGPLAPLAELLEKGSLAPDRLLLSFNRIYAIQCLDHRFRQEPRLAQFSGVTHTAGVERFIQLDRDRLNLAKARVLHVHYNGMPDKLPVGMTGTLLGEVQKQRRHKPVRRLLKEAGPIIQNLKPVFMMSPLSVAQYLQPGALSFDLLVIDEASQVQPVDALGAIARCKQIVVVGDDKQLPPTMFFSKMTSNNDISEEDEDEEGQVKAAELESILSLCKARGIHDTLLRWHYRSRHESLIAVSNKRYYDNKLYIVPSPWKQNAGLGLVWRPVNGIYDRANTSSNRREAEAVAQAVLNHACQHPELTLGVAAFSMAQQRALQDEVERLRHEHSDVMEAFMNKHPHEPFFVKNLENVQGDERDVIFLSVGYGKDAQGRMFQNFGPLNRPGGERRLNVLISRARRRCEVFSSINEQDIVPGEKTGEGVLGLKHFLQYARTGIFHLAEQTGRPIGSPFEEAVKEALERSFPNWEVHTQVGVAGFFIDLAIPDPEKPGRYVLGIECDGVAYHSSPSARERDRLRQSVLESQGWTIHRLWSIDFFRKPDQEIAKIKAAFDAALANLQSPHAVHSTQDAIPNTQDAGRTTQDQFQLAREQEERPSGFTVPYQAARGIAVPDDDPYRLVPGQVAALLRQVLAIEAPIHFDELVTRMRELWGWARAADKFRNHIGDGLHHLERRNEILQEDGFIFLAPATHPVAVRRRDESAPAGTRKPAYIPPIELDAALLRITETALSLSRDEAAKEVSVAIGLKTLSAEMKGIIEKRIDGLVEKGVLKEGDGRICLG